MTAQGPSGGAANRPLLPKLYLAIAAVVALVALSAIGLILTDMKNSSSETYWTIMFPLFGAVSIFHSCGSGGLATKGWHIVLVKEIGHWVGPIVFLKLIYLQRSTGQINPDEVGLVTLIVLALTCFLAGVHFAPHFLWVSLVLFSGVTLATDVERYFFIVLMVSGGVTLAAVAAMVFSYRRKAKKAA